jgi:hypothetical protein
MQQGLHWQVWVDMKEISTLMDDESNLTEMNEKNLTFINQTVSSFVN